MAIKRHLVAVLPNLAGGGAERVMLTLLAGIDRRKLAPALILLDGRGPLASQVPTDMPVETLHITRLRHAIPTLLRSLRHREADIIFSTLGYVNLALAAVRDFFPGRLVLREANLPSQSLPQTDWPWLMKQSYRLLYRRADLVLASSRRMQLELENLGVKSASIEVLLNPVQIDAVRRRAARPRRVTGAGLRLVAAGRLTPQKGFDRLILLLAQLGDLHLTILGEGPQRAELVSLAADSGVKLELPGFVDDVAAWFAGADAVLVPSRWEGMPNVALEALACGTPVIATSESGAIDDLASAAIPGSVTVAEFGAAFAAAVRSIQPRTGSALQPSLLPADYQAAVVGGRFTSLLEVLLAGRTSS